VGLCSYALIGFWYQKLENARAGTKAFLVTRVGDVFLAAALLWLFALTGTLSIAAINTQAATFSPAVLTALTVLLLLGACGKSAQLPLMTWLADAMAGPTPVSALIHAATMVTAGVYLLCRLFPPGFALPGRDGGDRRGWCPDRPVCRDLRPGPARDQAGPGLFDHESGRLHVSCRRRRVGRRGHVPPAHPRLFQAALFMAAGCVIHLAGDENDLMRMGGLGKHGPRGLFAVFLAGALCLAGAPLTGGFFSKDGILLAAYTQGACCSWSCGASPC